MIPLDEQEQLRAAFSRTLTGRVKIDLFTQRPTTMLVPGREECALCHQAEVLLQELVQLSPLFSLAVHELGAERELQKRLGVDRVPAVVLRGVLNRPVTFFGAPLGELLPPLIDALVLLSLNKSQLKPAVAKKLKRVHEPVLLLLFVSLQSPYCAPMMSAAVALSVETKFVKPVIVEVDEFPRWAERYQVKQVPYTVLNDRVVFPGAVEVDVLADQVVKAATSRTISVELPKSQGATNLVPAGRPQPPPETVRPSGLIIPGR